jgi:hypothetical protein
VFEGRQYRNGMQKKELRVTVGGTGVFYINRIGYNALGMPSAVELLYDADRRIVGLRATDPRKRNAFKLMPHGGKNYWRVSAASFCQHYGYRFERTMLIDKAELSDDGVLELPMDSAIAVARGAR